MGVRITTAARRLLFLAALLLVSVPSVTACVREDIPPDLSSREAFASSVMTAATSGSVERVEKLVLDDRLNVGPEAQQLVESTRDWAPGSWQLLLSNDFPAVATVEASRSGLSPTVRYQISWSQGRWVLILGEPKNPPPGGGGLGIGKESNPKILPDEGQGDPVPIPSTGQLSQGCTDAGDSSSSGSSAGTGGAAGTGAGAGALACRQFTSTAGNARGQNLSWLASTPLHLSFDPMNESLTMVVRMPCGVFNVPVSAGAFSLTPVPGGLVESADGCTGSESNQRSWTTAYFREPLIYRLDPQTLTFTNGSGQIRFTRD
jgi:hypothetical protein